MFYIFVGFVLKGRRKRSWDGIASTFKKYEDKLKKAATYIGEVFQATAEDVSLNFFSFLEETNEI